jgi:hypothetical protein
MIVRPTHTPRITPKDAESHKPTIHEIVGNFSVMKELRARAHLPPEAEANILVVGEQGTGPSATLMAHIRQQLRDPDFGIAEDFDFSTKAGQIYRGIRIEGASISKPQLENQVQLAIHGWGCMHTLVLLNDVNVALERGLDAPLNDMLSHPNVTTYGTASTLKEVHLGGLQDETDRRIRDFIGQFRIRRRTEHPEPEELYQFLSTRLCQWGIETDDERTVRLLVKKSGCVVGHALGALIEALGRNPFRPCLTFDLVSEYDPDPLKF